MCILRSWSDYTPNPFNSSNISLYSLSKAPKSSCFQDKGKTRVQDKGTQDKGTSGQCHKAIFPISY